MNDTELIDKLYETFFEVTNDMDEDRFVKDTALSHLESWVGTYIMVLQKHAYQIGVYNYHQKMLKKVLK